MADILGIYAVLTTGNQPWAGTDDNLYLGVAGARGGREFNLDVAGFDDFEPGTIVNYHIGQGTQQFASLGHPDVVPITAPVNLVGGSKIEVQSVTQVYLRKQSGRDVDSDDAWKLEDVYLFLLDGEFAYPWVSRGPLVLSIEDGLQVWLEYGFGDDYSTANVQRRFAQRNIRRPSSRSPRKPKSGALSQRKNGG